MTKELHLKLVAAWWDGDLEFDDDGDWIKAHYPPCETSIPEAYRIRPKPTLRPWKPEEVPVGAQFRLIGGGARMLIVGVDSSQLYCGVAPTFCPLAMAFQRFEHSTDGGKNWKPCGVPSEESQ